MSILRQPSANDVERWSARDAAANEPVSLPLGALGWQSREVVRDGSQPNLRVWSFERYVDIPELVGMERPCDRQTLQRAELVRWWDQPLTPGGPMKAASTRTVTTAEGRPIEVQTTSMFGGVSRVVDVVFLHGADWYARVLFENTWREDVDAALALLVLRASGSAGAP